MRNIEAEVLGPKYGPRPFLSPEKRSFRGRLHGYLVFRAEVGPEVFLIFNTRLYLLFCAFIVYLSVYLVHILCITAGPSRTHRNINKASRVQEHVNFSKRGALQSFSDLL